LSPGGRVRLRPKVGEGRLTGGVALSVGAGWAWAGVGLGRGEGRGRKGPSGQNADGGKYSKSYLKNKFENHFKSV
jgi:hypothetical protein